MYKQWLYCLMILYERAQFEGKLLQLLIELQEQPRSLYDVCIGTISFIVTSFQCVENGQNV